MKKSFFALLVFLLMLSAGVVVKANIASVESTGKMVPAEVINVKEGVDFATREMREAWDMNEYSDISQYLNESGQRDIVKDIQVADGVFSGTSVKNVANGVTANFYPLFPGYGTPTGEPTIMVGKIGYNYPIKSSEYSCLYIAMKVDSRAANSFGPDQFILFWWKNYKQSTFNEVYGRSSGIPLYPEAGAAEPTPGWRLYEIDLANPPNGLVDSPNVVGWNSEAEWQGIRIDPTINEDVNFAVDWVRLTDCNSVNTTVTVPSGVSAIYVRPANADSVRDIRVANNVTAGAYELDVQGLEAGTYQIGFGTETTCCVSMSEDTLVVHPAPIAEFRKPSFTSGTDYATQAGNAWDFEDASDVTDVVNSTQSFANGELELITPSGPLPAGIDAQVKLNTPQAFDPAEYRYISWRMFSGWTSWPYGDIQWQNVTQGMIIRLVWTIPSLTGQPGFECHLVSRDIGYDVGWQTYTFDLHDPHYGHAEEQAPAGTAHCPATLGQWLTSGQIVKMRFDPNENVTCNPDNPPEAGVVPCSEFQHKIDWISLTKVDQVAAGTAFPVRIELNINSAQISSINYYYTSDPNTAPTQNPAQPVVANTERMNPIQLARGSNTLYLPVISRDYIAGQTVFNWDTTGVAAGDYHICAVINDTFGSTVTHCSEAPVRVNP